MLSQLLKFQITTYSLLPTLTGCNENDQWTPVDILALESNIPLDTSFLYFNINQLGIIYIGIYQIVILAGHCVYP